MNRKSRFALLAIPLAGAVAFLTACQPTPPITPPSNEPATCASIPALSIYDYSNGYVYRSQAQASTELIGYQIPPFMPNDSTQDPPQHGGAIYADPADHWRCGTINALGTQLENQN